MPYYPDSNYILDGHTPVACNDFLKWAKWMEFSGDARRVGLTLIGPYKISTVFLGGTGLHDRATGRPLLFETMVFNTETDDLLDLLEKRYITWEEAESGHHAISALVRASHPGLSERAVCPGLHPAIARVNNWYHNWPRLLYQRLLLIRQIVG